MELESGKIGSVGEQKVSFEKGKLVAEVGALAGPAEVSVLVKIDAGQALDMIANAIPGHFDDALLAGAKMLLAQLG